VRGGFGAKVGVGEAESGLWGPLAMIRSTTETTYTPEDLLTMPDGQKYELVDGKLVERHMGVLSDRIGFRLANRLEAHCETHPLGWVLMPSSGGYQYAPRQLRKPDVVFIRYGRFPGEQLPPGHAQLAPDLAVEVSSPNDLYDDVEAKVEESLRAGVRLIWVI